MCLPRNLIAMLLLCCMLESGCAIAERENRPTLNALDRAVEGTFITSSTPARIVSLPLAVPVATLAGVVDMAVIAPVRAAGPAWRDTHACLWNDPQGSDMRQVMLFIPKAVATPLLFSGGWAVRSLMGSTL